MDLTFQEVVSFPFHTIEWGIFPSITWQLKAKQMFRLQIYVNPGRGLYFWEQILLLL